LPGTMFAWAVSTVLIFATVLQARNRLRLAFTSSLIAAVSCLPAICVALVGGTTLRYAWALALGQIAAACVVAKLTSNLLQRGWFRRGVVPPMLAAVVGALVILVIDTRIPGLRIRFRIVIDAMAFGLVIFFILRAFFASLLLEVVLRLPGRDFMRRILRV